MPKLVCMIGVIGAGKDYRAKQLVKQGYAQINFADTLRELAWEILGFVPEDYERFKKQEFIIYSEKRSERVTFTHIRDGRSMLQNLGTAMRKREPEFFSYGWFDKVFDLLSDYKNVVCSDLRHINELKTALDVDQEVFGVGKDEIQFLADVEFVFCDYRSDRYEPDNAHESEHLAQRILKDGHKDGDILTVEYLKSLLKK